MAIKLKLEGFDELLKEIEKAGGDAQSVTKDCLKKSADIMQDELKSQMQKSDVPSNLINAMPAPEIEEDYGLITARVGYRKGSYDPKNLSDGYKIVFLNYGTPYRKKHGKVKERGFIQRAKSRAKKKIQKQQEEALKEILRGLQ